MKTSIQKPLAILAIFLLAINLNSFAQKQSFNDSWANAGFNLDKADTRGLEITYSVEEFTFTDFDLKGEAMQNIQLEGSFLPNNEGAPNLPGNGQYIAVPTGADVQYTITAERVETYKNVNIAPAPRIPKVTDEGPTHYAKDSKYYQTDSFYPTNPVSLSEKTSVRGVEAVILGITPFQYNPVTKELKVYRDLKVEVSFNGGSGVIGDARLRSPYFDPILSDMMINYANMPQAEHPVYNPESGTPDYEYVIITPDDDDFISWAQELALFRNMQGIRTGIFTTTDVGGNTTTAIESFVNDAYANWAIPPVAVLLIGDFGTTGNTIISPIWSSYCASDNIYADVDGNDLPDIAFARMTAQNESQLETMITKVINYESNPPTNPDFYNNPITALGWQDERWFQICSETVGGYFKHVQGKDPVRINAIYSGNPGSIWSTNQNTHMVTDYFGPDGLGYIPETPAELGGWTGGNDQDVINALNSGAFILQHRDHGATDGWGEPDFRSNDIDQLTNTDLSFIFSINCLTGKYNISGECFTEKFHRYTYNGENAGALGLIAASEVSYSFVNDTYVWGMFDNMWPDFMPDETSEAEERGLLPAFGNMGGKYFLEQSSWPYNPQHKVYTHHLFHHHGCAFSTLYSEVPQNLTAIHDNVLLAGITQFEVTANEGALIALSVDGEIIGTAVATGSPVSIPIIAQQPPTIVDLVITKTNYYRYHAEIDVIPPAGPYVIQNDAIINDESGNNNGMIDYGESVLMSLEMKNVGNENGDNIEVTISTSDPYVTITNDQASYGTVPAGETKTVVDGFAFDVAQDIPDLHTIQFDVMATDGSENWESITTLTGHSVVLEYIEVAIDDAAGNGNGKLDPGETAILNITLGNVGSSDAYEVAGELTTDNILMDIETPNMEYGDIAAGSESTQSFIVTPGVATPAGTVVDFVVDFDAPAGFMAQGLFSFAVGQMPILIIDLDENQNSGAHIHAAIQDLGFGADYTAQWPQPGTVELYSSIFLCLGIFSDNYILNVSQGTELATYLSEGGRLYMEGGDTWAYDDQTPVHAMFNINGTDDGNGDLNQLSGQAGSFTEGMSFNYSGDNNWIDHIEPISPAFPIFENGAPQYYTGIAHDGGVYKTIGASFEFGGLDNGSGISTRTNLMQEYLDFFGINMIDIAPGQPSGNQQACQNSEVPYTTNSVEGANMYYWTIEPATAGTVMGVDTNVTIHWADDYMGMAYVRVCALNGLGVGPTSDSLAVEVTEAPTAVMAGTVDVCPGEDVELSVELSGTAPWHLVINGHPYTAGSSPFTFTVSPTANTSYTVSSVRDATFCENIGDGSTEVMMIDVPGQADTPTGPAQVNTGDTPTSTYTTTGALHANSYQWEVIPAEAQKNLEISGNDCIVTWSGNYNGPATVEVRVSGVNDCGIGPFSQTFSVEMQNVGIGEIAGLNGVSLFPNPNKGTFTLEIVNPKLEKANLRIMNSSGVVVYTEKDITINENFSSRIDISTHAEGIYILLLESELGIFTQKIILQK